MSKQGPEALLKAAVMEKLRMIQGVHPIRHNAGKMFIQGRWVTLGEAGTPDIQVLLPKKQTIWLELKSEKGKESPDQARWREMATIIGHEVFTIRDVDSAVAVVTLARDEAKGLT